jgi:O-antigen/teichoic acid export membrane protein
MAKAGTQPLPQPESDVLDSPAAGRLVIRGGAIRIVGYAVNIIAAVISSAVLLRYLGVNDAGRYTTVISLASVVAMITDAGMTSVGIREYTQLEEADRDRRLRALLGVRIAVALVGMAGMVAFAAVAGYTTPMLAGAAFGGAGVVVLSAVATWTTPLAAGLRLGWLTTLESLRWVLNAALTVVLSLAAAGLLALLAVQLPVALAVAAAALALFRARVPLTPSWDRREWRRLMRTVLPVGTASAVYAIYAYLTVVLLQLVSTAHQTGLFSAAFRVFITVAAVPSLFAQSAFPVLARAARDDEHRLAYALQRLLDVTLLAGGFAAALTVVGAPVAIAVVAGDEFTDSIPVLRVQGLALAMSFVVAFGAFALLSLHRHRALLRATAVAFTLSATLTLVLGHVAGAHGAAYANLGGETVLAVGYGVALSRAPGGRDLTLWPALRVVVAGGAAIAVGLLSGLPSLPATVLAGVVYLLLALLMRAVPEEVLVEARRVARRP